MSELHPDARYHAKKDVVSCELDGGLALLDLRSSKYYKLNATAALVWAELKNPASIADLTLAIEQTFDVDAQDCEVDVVAILQHYRSAGLLDERA